MRARIAIAVLALGCTAETVSESGVPTSDPATPEAPEPDVPTPPDAAVELDFHPGTTPDAPVLFVFIGDSISKGHGASDDAWGYDSLLWSNDDDTYPEWRDLDLITAYPSIDRAVDVAFAGATTQSVLDAGIPALDTWLEEAYPDGVPGETVVFLTVGGNDVQAGLLPGSDPAAVAADAAEGFDAVVDALLDPARFDRGVHLYATNVYEPSGGVGQSSCFFGFAYPDVLDDLVDYNVAVRQTARDRGFTMVDLYTAFLPHGANADDPTNPAYDASDPTNWFASDCIHPNDRGHHEIRRLMWDAVRPSVELP